MLVQCLQRFQKSALCFNPETSESARKLLVAVQKGEIEGKKRTVRTMTIFSLPAICRCVFGMAWIPRIKTSVLVDVLA